MRAVIFANGVLNLPHTRSVLRAGDIIIAADGGLHHCQDLGVTPAVVIGDLDSLLPDEISALQAAEVEIIRYPARKDQTDFELALRYAVSLGADEIIGLGALGARWDMTIANILLLGAPELAGLTVRLIDRQQEIMLLRGEGKITFHGRRGDTLSLMPLGQDARGVTLVGLEYPLADGTLRFSSTRGISNVLGGKTATVYLKQGLLLCTLMHQGDFTAP